MMPSALVTGASGFIGSHLVKELSTRGYALKALVRPAARIKPETASLCEITWGDLADDAKLREAVLDVDYVFHCAANVSTWDADENYQQINIHGVANLCNAIRDANPNLKRVVHLSTVDVYDFPDNPADEAFEKEIPRYLYGASKLQGEKRLIEAMSAHKIPFCILRPCNVIGPHSQFIRRIGDALKSGVMLEIDRGTHHAGLLSVKTLIDCMIWAAESPEAQDKIFNVRNPENISWHEFLFTFKKGIQGRGLLLNLSYPAAKALGGALSSIHKLVASKREPIWHPLLTEIFGKTCAHSVNQIQAAGAPLNKHSLKECISDSIKWYNEHHA
jgi:nucleoside-diphosphate-sugar epimerase